MNSAQGSFYPYLSPSCTALLPRQSRPLTLEPASFHAIASTLSFSLISFIFSLPAATPCFDPAALQLS